jgi:hypothetical protein
MIRDRQLSSRSLVFLDMRRLTIALTAALAFPALAAAKEPSRTIAPPGVSGIQQYVETVPTAQGGEPTTSVHSGGSGHGGPGHSGGGGITGGGGGGSGGGGGDTSNRADGSAIPSSTQRAMNSDGASGQAAAALAARTAPTPSQQGGSGAHVSEVPSGVSSAARSTSPSPVSAIFKTLTGSSSDGGLGTVLPIILVAALLGFSGLAIVRRRRTTT